MKRQQFLPAVLERCIFKNNHCLWANSLAQDYLKSSWSIFSPTRWDFATFFGTVGLFLFLFFIFIRLLPMISIFEVRTLLPPHEVGEEAGD